LCSGLSPPFRATTSRPRRWGKSWVLDGRIRARMVCCGRSWRPDAEAWCVPYHGGGQPHRRSNGGQAADATALQPAIQGQPDAGGRAGFSARGRYPVVRSARPLHGGAPPSGAALDRLASPLSQSSLFPPSGRPGTQMIRLKGGQCRRGGVLPRPGPGP